MRLTAILGVLLTAASPVAVQAQVAVDVELVLAVDVSRSMDYDELTLQREGYAAALEHPAVTSAFGMGAHGRVALMMFEWGGPGQVRLLLDWMVLEGPEDAAVAAQALRQTPVGNLRGTSISAAMEVAGEELETNDFHGTRRVIDISGDGPNNTGRPVEPVRDALAAKGIEVNGLPFMVKTPGGAYTIRDLDFYYEDCVITGDSAFVIPIREMDRLVASIRQKLILEVAGWQPERPARFRRVAKTDCLIGEKLRRQWQEP
ncbi:DUF1194 domain-containing protein [Algicella marina]|nr:DUF1194 domain-containing protein [Algicella marina]